MMLFGMLAVLAFIGCDDKFTGGQSGLTEHVVRLAVSCDAFQEKSILPSGQTLAIASYDISGTGPEGASFSLEGQAENEHHSFNLGYLAIGSWHLSAVARNAEGSAIARGEADIFLSRKSTNATLVLDSLVGKGNLEVHVSWAKDQVKQEDCTLIAKTKKETMWQSRHRLARVLPPSSMTRLPAEATC